jgi:hypothetical protein
MIRKKNPKVAGKHRLQLLQARLKPEQEHALRHQGIDEVRVTAPSTFSCGITRMMRIARSLDSMVSACAASSRSA